MAMTAAPATAATPMLARFIDAAPVEDPPAAVLVAEADEEAAAELEAALLDEADEDAIEAAEEEETGADDDAAADDETLAGLLLEAAALDEALALLAAEDEPDAEPVAEPAADEDKQPADPALTVKAADCAVAPVLSRRERPMEVPAAMSVDQVYEVPVWVPRLSRAAAEGWLPGWMLKK
jgi:hypothetical protein